MYRDGSVDWTVGFQDYIGQETEYLRRPFVESKIMAEISQIVRSLHANGVETVFLLPLIIHWPGLTHLNGFARH